MDQASYKVFKRLRVIWIMTLLYNISVPCLFVFAGTLMFCGIWYVCGYWGIGIVSILCAYYMGACGNVIYPLYKLDKVLMALSLALWTLVYLPYLFVSSILGIRKLKLPAMLFGGSLKNVEVWPEPEMKYRIIIKNDTVFSIMATESPVEFEMVCQIGNYRTHYTRSNLGQLLCAMHGL